MSEQSVDDETQTPELTDKDLEMKMKEKWQEMKKSTEKRASLSSALAKQVNETTQTVSKLSDQGNKLVVKDLDPMFESTADQILAIAQHDAEEIKRKRDEEAEKLLEPEEKPKPKDELTPAEINDGELKGVTGGNLSDVVAEDKEGLWTSAGMQAVDNFLSSQFKAAA